MKLLKIFALTVLAAVTFAACSDDECDGNAGPLKIVASQTSIPTLGGDGSVTVNQKVSEAYANEDWLTVSKSGNVVNVTAVPNNDRESRNAKLVIKSSPADSVIIAISQYGTIYNAEGMTNIAIGPSTRSFAMPVIHNVDTKVKECPSWVSAQIVEDKLLITVADNTGVEPREGLIKVGTVKYTNTIKVMQGANADGLTEIEAGPEGKPAKVAVVKGTQVVEAPEWVDAQIVKDSLVVAVQENTAMESRQGVVKYGTDKYTNTIKVTQDAVVFDLSKVEDNIVVEAEASKVTIPVTYNGTLKVYSCPEWVTATVKADGIALDVAVNQEYEARSGEIEFGTSIYKHAVKITQEGLTAPLEWNPLGKAVYTDDCVLPLFGEQPLAYYVDIEEKADQPGLYRIVNPYGAAFPYNEPGDWDDTKDYYMILDCTNPEACYIPEFATGCDWGYGEFTILSYVDYYLQNGYGLEQVPAQYFGTLKDGVLTFPAKALLIYMAGYQNNSIFYANQNGAFSVVLPSAAAKAATKVAKKAPAMKSRKITSAMRMK